MASALDRHAAYSYTEYERATEHEVQVSQSTLATWSLNVPDHRHGMRERKS